MLGKGIETTKYEFNQKQAVFPEFKSVKIALIGAGQVHGEDDAIAMRPYQASLKCTVSGSQILVLSRSEFYRMFKNQQECWRSALSQAKTKEKEYIKRCRSYLDVNKQLVEELKIEEQQKDKKKAKQKKEGLK